MRLGFAVAAAVLIACTAPATAEGPGPKHPFGAEVVAFPPGTLRPSEPQSGLDGATAAFYDAWKTRYAVKGCGAGELRIKADAGAAVTVSEGQGYGMVIVALMAGHEPQAQAMFDALYRYARRHPSAFDPMLMAWAQDGACRDIEGRDSATDGDLDIAYGLLLADAQWGSAGGVDYRGEAKRTLAAIVRRTVDADTGLMLLGDWVTPEDPHAKATRPSDWMIDHFRVFAAIDPRPWNRAVEAHLDLAIRLQREYSPRTGLLPDFVVATGSTPKPAPPNFLEADTDGDFAWNACRTPWRLGVDALVSGDPRSVAAVRQLTAWIRTATEGDPGRIGESYRLDGSVLDPASSMAYVAPFAVAAMSAGAEVAGAQASAQEWLDALWQEIAARPPEGYYADSIKLQVMLAVAGHWWQPEQVGRTVHPE
jgi:endo-1,4-beta-D-glucanase Y